MTEGNRNEDANEDRDAVMTAAYHKIFIELKKLKPHERRRALDSAYTLFGYTEKPPEVRGTRGGPF